MRTKMQLHQRVSQRVSFKTVLAYASVGLAFAGLVGGFIFFYLNIGDSEDAMAKNTTYESADTGWWSDAGTWSSSTPSSNPVGQNSTVNINAGHEVTANNLTLQQNNIVNITGTLVVEGNFNMDQGAEITVEDGGILIVMGNYEAEHHLTLQNGGKLVVLGTITTGGQTDVINDGEFYTDSDVTVSDGNATQPLNDLTSDSELTTTLENHGYNTGTLPIELMSFNVENTDEGVLVKWVTSSEIDNDYFTIERSTNGKDFKVVGTVDGAGTSMDQLSYTFVDEQPIPGKSYYRLKQTDFDGQYEYFQVKAIERLSNETKAPELNIMRVGPNPFKDRFTITYESDASTDMHIKLVNANGKEVYSEAIASNIGTQTYTFNEGTQLGRDFYVLYVQANGKTLKPIKLMKN